MRITRNIEEYADILNAPPPEPKHHVRMTEAKRAAQFAPFAALQGYEAMVEKTVQKHVETVEKDW